MSFLSFIIPNLPGASSLFNSILGGLVSINTLVLGNLEALASTFSALLGAELRTLKAAIFGIIPEGLISIPVLNLQAEIADLIQLPPGLAYAAKLAEIEGNFGSAILAGARGYTLDSIVKAATGTLLPDAPRSLASVIPNMQQGIDGVIDFVADAIGSPISAVLEEVASVFPINTTINLLKGIFGDGYARNAIETTQALIGAHITEAEGRHNARSERLTAAVAAAQTVKRAVRAA